MNLNIELTNRFSGKSVAVLGCGKEGVAVGEFLIKFGATIQFRDTKSIDQIKSEISKSKVLISKIKELSIIGGDDYLNDLNAVDIIVRSPGVPYLTPKIQEAKKNGVEVTSQTEIFLNYHSDKTIAVTGTKGKSTTSSLVYQLLLDGGKKVRYGGNIGEPFINWLTDMEKGEMAILELSSFQLQGISCSPHVAVVQDITIEHLDYHQTLEEYVASKANIVSHQNNKDLTILNGDSLTSVKFAMLTRACIAWFSAKKLVDPGVYVKKYSDGYWIVKSGLLVSKKIIHSSEIKLQGEHNLSNICAAVVVALSYGISFRSIVSTLKNYSGLPHRQFKMGTIKGREWIDDSFATAPDSTIAAINSFSSRDPLLIVGGSSKGYGFDSLAEAIVRAKISRVILIGQTADEIGKAVIAKAKTKSLELPMLINGNYKTMRDIIAASLSESNNGDLILFSPGCASFGLFKNVYDRASQFESEVGKLT